MIRGAVWFRSDLRIDDNPALLDATNACEEVIGIYIFSENQWSIHNESNIKHEFLLNNLNKLEKSLNEFNIPLIAINAEDFKSLHADLSSFVTQHKIEHVFWNKEFGVNEIDRDNLVSGSLKKINVSSSSYHDQV
ncbi:MAG: deoxyribodipyrimidine photo-lyase, partial [SAR86 cluster bacterium]|nr:deoxyribodipyrimidine photo-lyase [SAR86 cluster bacterium]